jgi:K+-transporting ATPase KdpC subunit
MLSYAKSQLKTSCIFFLLFGLVTGIIYPCFITLCAQLLFAKQANGSLILQNDKIIGSELIGQEFVATKYFWGRPSATKPHAYNAMHSKGSNFGQTNQEYINKVHTKVNFLRTTDPEGTAAIPVDLCMASGSGLDPDISMSAALFQVPRVALTRKIDAKIISDLVFSMVVKDYLTTRETIRINVLKLNLALDALKP